MFLLQVSLVTTQPQSVLTARKYSDNITQRTEDDLEKTYTQYFNRPDIDGWEIRKVYYVIEFFEKSNYWYI